MEGVQMVDSVGIGVIIAAHNTLNQSQRELKVINVTKDVYGLFTTMRLNRRFVVEGVE
jgi:anti-anti-sigma regulatory factor